MDARPDQALPSIEADLLLLHAPACFDFRQREDIYFPYLATTGDVPITPLYEIFPVGFATLAGHLGARGRRVRVLNLASLLMLYPAADADEVLGALEVRLVGLDLHWMVHVQGSLAVAERLRRVRPEVPIVFGGISSTYYAVELVRYPFVDMVMRGYDTHAPMEALLDALGDEAALARVPNLLWKDRRGRVIDNGLTHLPATFGGAADWSAPADGTTRPPGTVPIRELLTVESAGCTRHCGWCGGSRAAFRRVNGTRRPIAWRERTVAEREWASIAARPDAAEHHLYTVGTYNQGRERLSHTLAQVRAAGLRSVAHEQFALTPPEALRAMVAAHPRTVLTLSPESHDPLVARLAGRGVYSQRQMEDWIARALDAGIFQVDVWYFVGMPEQDERSVHETVDACERMLARFAGRRVVPFICPMIPFLDPASTFFEEPERHGYRVFCRTVEDHRRAMEQPSIIDRVNYETRWLSRADLVRVGYDAVRRLTQAKGQSGLLPRELATWVTTRIDDARAMIGAVHEAAHLPDPADRDRELRALGPEILRRNQALLFGGVANQAFPLPRRPGGRWFDELLWPSEVLEACCT